MSYFGLSVSPTQYFTHSMHFIYSIWFTEYGYDSNFWVEFCSFQNLLPVRLTLLITSSITRKKENWNTRQRENFVFFSIWSLSIKIQLICGIAFCQFLWKFYFLHLKKNVVSLQSVLLIQFSLTICNSELRKFGIEQYKNITDIKTTLHTQNKFYL